MNTPKIKKLPLSIKLFFFPIWLLASVSTMIGSFWLLDVETRERIRSVIVASDDIITAQTYNLFAALPKKGEVLAQRISYSDIRAVKLREFLRFYRSPMADSADAFIEIADRYDLPWALLPAIACKESGCGRIIPVGSYNAFGWAVYAGQNSGAAFDSWEHAIETVAKGLRNNYFNNGMDTVEKIEVHYTPQSARSHNGWQTGVKYFMEELENWKL